jgi:hypothetical protein
MKLVLLLALLGGCAARQAPEPHGVLLEAVCPARGRVGDQALVCVLVLRNEGARPVAVDTRFCANANYRPNPIENVSVRVVDVASGRSGDSRAVFVRTNCLLPIHFTHTRYPAAPVIIELVP